MTRSSITNARTRSSAGLVRMAISPARAFSTAHSGGRSARREKLSLPITGLRRDDAGGSTTPSRSARKDERFDRLQRALLKLTREQRVVLEMSTIEGLKAPEIAARTGKTPEAVRQLLVRALRGLRRNFGETESLQLPDKKLDFDSLKPGAEPGRGT